MLLHLLNTNETTVKGKRHKNTVRTFQSLQKKLGVYSACKKISAPSRRQHLLANCSRHLQEKEDIASGFIWSPEA